MCKNIIIFIWEWNSEIAFLKEFIKRRYNISWEHIKNGILYKVLDNFIVFAHPIIGSKKHKWWDKTFKSPKTYIDINRKILDSSYAFWNIWKYSFTYLFLTDKDKINSDKKLDWVEKLIEKYCSKYKWEICIIYAVKEIETWFLVGLWDDFIDNYKWINKKKLDIFLQKDIEKESSTKEFLKNIILKDTDISSSQEYLWREFWKYLDIEKAEKNSNSFKEFVKKLDSLFEH